LRKFVALRNLDRYRTLLANETDPARRAVLERLLSEEQEIWDGLSRDAADPDKSDDPDGADKP
jgi:hypothetical protein